MIFYPPTNRDLYLVGGWGVGRIFSVFGVPLGLHFGGQKSRFMDFFKVVLELFRKCLGIVFGLKMPTFWSIFSLKG